VKVPFEESKTSIFQFFGKKPEKSLQPKKKNTDPTAKYPTVVMSLMTKDAPNLQEKSSAT